MSFDAHDQEDEPPLPTAQPNPIDVPTGQMSVVDGAPVPDPADLPTGELPPEAGAGLPAQSALGAAVAAAARTRRAPHLESAPTRPTVRKPTHDDWVDMVERWFPERYRVPTIVTTAVSLALTAAFLFLPLAGTDLSAQVAHGHFFEVYGWHTIDFRWYGGIYPFGYSMLAGPLNALIGSRGVGAVSCVLASSAFAWLLARYQVRRPTIGGVLAAMVGVFNLVSGRTTFALGLAIGMFALIAVGMPRAPRWLRLTLGVVLAALSTAGSPLAGLFIGLAGGAVLLVGLRAPDRTGSVPWRRSLSGALGPGAREGAALCVGAILGLIPMGMFPDGGTQPFTSDSMKVFVAVGVAMFFLVPKRYRAIRVGAALMIVLTVASYVVHSPLGSNVTRLPMLYCAPLVAAVSTLNRKLLVGAIVALTWWQPPLITVDLGHAGDSAAQSVFYQPLIAHLRTLAPIGRIEVVPLYDHWESTYVAEAVPLARGWERQVDVKRNPLFYDNNLAPDNYLAWLYHNAVSYVAVPSDDMKLDRYGKEESNLIAAKLPYLRKTWSNVDWTLYQVLGAQQLVTGVGVLVDSGPTGVVFDTTTSGNITVRVRWSRWLTLAGPDACLRPGPDDWVNVTVSQPGRYRISSGWHLRQAHRC